MLRVGRKFTYLVFAVGLGCFILLTLNVYELNKMEKYHVQYHHEDLRKFQEVSPIKIVPPRESPIFAVYGHDVDSGYLHHVFSLFQYLGFSRGSLNNSEWDVLWAHDYPFQKFYNILKNLKPYQKVNHFPGTGFITNKMDLAVSDIPHIPKAFKIPEQQEELKFYVSQHPNKKFVQKSNDHRGIKIIGIEQINVGLKGSFVQEYIDNPLLVDGRKFDVGVYTIITSIDPLRVYTYNGDVLFRYCTEKYYPFNEEAINKYVIGDDYLPTWEVESLKKYYTELGFSMKDSFNAYLQKLGRDPDKIWIQVEEAIRAVCLNKEPMIINLLSRYRSKRNFFEMVRFDFVVDNNLNVYIMEANMSPNLSSAHFSFNRLLYEQVLFNLFTLVGIPRITRRRRIDSMEVADKNIVVNPLLCSECESCVSPNCQLCLPCLSNETKTILKEAYLEHINKLDCKRIYPPFMNATLLENYLNNGPSPENHLMLRWFYGKCILDSSWC